MLGGLALQVLAIEPSPQLIYLPLLILENQHHRSGKSRHLDPVDLVCPVGLESLELL